MIFFERQELKLRAVYFVENLIEILERQAAEGYANATREQALAIAVRMVENLG